MIDISKVLIDFSEENPDFKILASISTTSFKQKNKISYTSYPKKINENIYFFHCIFVNHYDANKFIKLTQKKVSKYYLDIENKNPHFSWKFINQKNSSINFYKIQTNHMTVNAILDIVTTKKNSTSLIVGSGNIALQLCMRLKLIDFDFNWVTHKITKSASQNFMKKSFDKYYLSSIKKFNFIINTIPKDMKIDFEKYINKNSVFIEVSGSPLEYLEKLNCSKIRLDISNQLISEINKINYLENNKPLFGRKKIGNNYVCSGGFLGKKNDLIVDNFMNPTFIVGISDGNGGILKRINLSFNPKNIGNINFS